MDNFNLRSYLAENKLLKENSAMETNNPTEDSWWVSANEELGLGFDPKHGDDLEDLAMHADESWQAEFAEQVLAIDTDNYEDYKNQVDSIYNETNPN